RLRDGGRASLWLWAATPALALLALAAIIVLSDADAIKRLGALTPWTAAIFLLTLLLPVATLAGLHAAWLARARGAGRKLRIWCWSLGLANVAATLYLAAHGLVGLRI